MLLILPFELHPVRDTLVYFSTYPAATQILLFGGLLSGKTTQHFKRI